MQVSREKKQAFPNNNELSSTNNVFRSGDPVLRLDCGCAGFAGIQTRRRHQHGRDVYQTRLRQAERYRRTAFCMDCDQRSTRIGEHVHLANARSNNVLRFYLRQCRGASKAPASIDFENENVFASNGEPSWGSPPWQHADLAGRDLRLGHGVGVHAIDSEIAQCHRRFARSVCLLLSNRCVACSHQRRDSNSDLSIGFDFGVRASQIDMAAAATGHTLFRHPEAATGGTFCYCLIGKCRRSFAQIPVAADRDRHDRRIQRYGFLARYCTMRPSWATA